MPLFGSGRDAKFLRSISRELMQRLISQEIAFYKLALGETEINLYGESNKKVYYNPVRLFCLIAKEDTTMNDVDTGMDILQNVTFAFLRDDLKAIDVVPEEGDVIHFDERYYEIDNTQTTQYWMGRNQETFLMNTEGRGNREFGYNIAISCKTHLTRISQLNLTQVRSGINTIKSSNFLPKNL